MGRYDIPRDPRAPGCWAQEWADLCDRVEERELWEEFDRMSAHHDFEFHASPGVNGGQATDASPASAPGLAATPYSGRENAKWPVGIEATLEVLQRLGTDACWPWPKHRDRHGYGTITWNKRKWFAHRASFTILVGPIPDGLVIDHLCLNRGCVNPAHLEPVTPEENNRRAGYPKTHCVHGHEYTEANTYIKPSGDRACRTCRRTQDEQSRAAVRRAA